MPSVVRDVKTIVENGELKISLTLDLNINLTQTHNESINIQKALPESKKELEKPKENEFLIPDFTSGETVEFGKLL